MSGVILKNIEKTFSNGNLAIDNLNLHIREGEFMVFVGPSGCSKSTILRMIAGLDTVSGGEIYIENRVVNKLEPKDRNIAMVFQNYALYPHMNVFNNLAFSLKMLKKPKDKIKQKVQNVLKMLELTDYFDTMPNEMSGGQKQRVAIGRSMVKKPKVFLFDEPLSNLDAKLRVQLRLEIIKFHQSLKNRNSPSTIIYVTHDQIEAMTMGDRICVLNYGKIMQVDTPMNLYNFPANKFVASFIGSPPMNIQKSNIEVSGEECFVNLLGNQFLLPKEKREKLKELDGKKIWFGIRPEDIKLNTENLKKNIIKGLITLVEKTGNEAFVYFKVMDELFVSRMNIESASDIEYGTQMEFTLDMDKCHIFEFFTEKNISL